MNKEEIMKIIPHRNSMLLIEDVVAEDGVAIGHYEVKGDEWFLDGHFPGNPVVPGVILCEMMAQTCCILLADKNINDDNITPYFTGIDKVRFKNQVKPGDKIEFECKINKAKAPFYFAQGKGSVNGKVCVTGEFSFALLG